MQFKPGEINIICSDLQQSLQFYRDLLGFSVETDDEGFYHLRCAHYQYLLLPIAQPTVPIIPYGSVPQVSLDLLVDDLEAAYRFCQQHGVAFAKEWTEGAKMFVIRDPDGLPWEVVQTGI
jgi:catechol 2,3-dioxygenase-like lactoylglutathione lyase family enzyme